MHQANVSLKYLKAHNRKRGVTLIELLLVLVLLTVMSGVAWVTLKPMIAHQHLHTAVDTIRSELCKGRFEAIKSGHTFAFRYTLHGDHFHLGPDSDAAPPAPSSGKSASSDSPVPDITVSARESVESSQDEPLPPAEDGTLPAGVEFVSAASDEVQANSAESNDTWSDPIYFYPDGSTSDAKLMLNGQRQSALQLSLRGVTGTVTVDDAGAVAQ